MSIENSIGAHLIESHKANCQCDLCKLVEYANTAMNVTSELNRIMEIKPPLFISEMPIQVVRHTRRMIEKARKSDSEVEQSTDYQGSLPDGHWLKTMSKSEIADTLKMEAQSMISGGAIFDDCPEHVRQWLRDKFALRLLVAVEFLKI